MQSATCQNDYCNKLSQREQESVDSWVNRRSSLIQLKSQRIISQRLETEPGMSSWKSSRFIKINVRALVKRGHSEPNVATKDGNEAMLTLWDPSEEQLSLLQEGRVVYFENVAVKEKEIDNLLQLSIRGKATMKEINPHPPLESLYLSGYRKREQHSLVRIHLESRRLSASSIVSPECDVIGYLLRVTKVPLGDNTRFFIYITDQTGLVLRIERDTFNDKDNELVHWEKHTHELGCGLLLHFLNIRIRPFDLFEGCAVGIWTNSSIYQKTMNNSHCCKLQNWSESSEEGKALCDVIIDRMNLYFPTSGKLPKEFAVIIGKVLNVQRIKGKNEKMMDIKDDLLLAVDVGTGQAIEFLLPNELLSKVSMICQQRSGNHEKREGKSKKEVNGTTDMMNVTFMEGTPYQDALLYFLVHVNQGIGKVTQVKPIHYESLIKFQRHGRNINK